MATLDENQILLNRCYVRQLVHIHLTMLRYDVDPQNADSQNVDRHTVDTSKQNVEL
jgi:hypothetical protein